MAKIMQNYPARKVLNREQNVLVINVCHQHYPKMPMRYTANFNDCKNGNFQMKNCDIVLIFAQNIKINMKKRSCVHVSKEY